MALIAFFSTGQPSNAGTTRRSHRIQVGAVKLFSLSEVCHVALGDTTIGQVLDPTPAGTFILPIDQVNLKPSTRLVVEIPAVRPADFDRFWQTPPVRWWRVGRTDCVTVARRLAATAGVALPFTMTPGALARALIAQGLKHEWYA